MGREQGTICNCSGRIGDGRRGDRWEYGEGIMAASESLSSSILRFRRCLLLENGFPPSLRQEEQWELKRCGTGFERFTVVFALGVPCSRFLFFLGTDKISRPSADNVCLITAEGAESDMTIIESASLEIVI